MKKSIAHIPKRKQEDLEYLVKLILERIPQTQMIILYGSYARGDYVEYDQRVEFGVPTSYMSDYDILVATHGIDDKTVGAKLDNIDRIYYKHPDLQIPVQFINEDIRTLNKYISDGRYFYTQIRAEGILLYDSGNFNLARKRKLNYKEIKQQAEEYYDEKYESAYGFLDGSKFFFQKKNYRLTSFMLHQATENFFYAVRLTYTLQNNKQHNLRKLIDSVRKYSSGFIQIFPCDTAEEKRLFELLKAAYVEGRYNPKFVVTAEDCKVLTQKVQALGKLVEELCRKRLDEYAQMIGSEVPKQDT
ncbi:MAG: HEPN domain-containing protein [Bacteroides sp.]|nr:HEPN domain-containing protein [Bacteroides sp.]